MPDDEPRGRNAGGGVRLLSSENVSQNSFPLELRMACCLKLLERIDDSSTIISSSGMPPKESCVIGPRLGEDCVVVVADIEGCRVGSRSMSLSRVRRTTSASRRNSVSTGALSSARAARIRAKPFVFGFSLLALLERRIRVCTHKHVAPPSYWPADDSMRIPAWGNWYTIHAF